MSDQRTRCLWAPTLFAPVDNIEDVGVDLDVMSCIRRTLSRILEPYFGYFQEGIPSVSDANMFVMKVWGNDFRIHREQKTQINPHLSAPD